MKKTGIGKRLFWYEFPSGDMRQVRLCSRIQPDNSVMVDWYEPHYPGSGASLSQLRVNVLDIILQLAPAP